MDLDVAQIRAFVAVVDHGHFGRAAESLDLTQQALSKRVARLEAGLGRLLERGRGGAVLTPAAERFLPGARLLLEVADRAVADARQTPAEPLRVDLDRPLPGDLSPELVTTDPIAVLVYAGGALAAPRLTCRQGAGRGRRGRGRTAPSDR